MNDMNVWLLVSGIVTSVLAGNVFLRKRAQKLADSRRGQGLQDFTVYFSGKDIPEDKLRLVYDYFQEWQSVKNFPVLPNDDLSKVYGIVDDDVDDAVIELADRWGATLPVTFDGLQPVRTVADVVHLLNKLPQDKMKDS